MKWDPLDDLAQNYVKKRKNQGLVIGIIHAGTRDIRGYGTYSRKDGHSPNALTIFEIGGLTSVFTTSAAMLASYNYDFEMNDPIQLHTDVEVPAFRPQIRMEIRLPNQQRIIGCVPDPLAESVCVSFCDLASHTAGMTCSCEDGYAWIISLLSEESNLPVYWINGGTGGYRAWMGFIKDTQTGLVLLPNSAQLVDEMAWAILELLHQ